MSDGRKKGPYGCKCQTLAHKLVGDGCDECQPMSDAPERVWLDPTPGDIREDGTVDHHIAYPYDTPGCKPYIAEARIWELEEALRARDEIVMHLLLRLEQALAGKLVRDADEVILATRHALNRETTDE